MKGYILIVEDNEGHARLLQRNLERQGIDRQMVVQADGRSALDILHRRGIYAAWSQFPELILLDLNLPDMHGSDILADIELDDQLRAVPRIIMTTSDEPEDLRRCRRYGYLDYMVKPANYQVLAEKIRDILT